MSNRVPSGQLSTYYTKPNTSSQPFPSHPITTHTQRIPIMMDRKAPHTYKTQSHSHHIHIYIIWKSKQKGIRATSRIFFPFNRHRIEGGGMKRKIGTGKSKTRSLVQDILGTARILHWKHTHSIIHRTLRLLRAGKDEYTKYTKYQPQINRIVLGSIFAQQLQNPVYILCIRCLIWGVSSGVFGDVEETHRKGTHWESRIWVCKTSTLVPIIYPQMSV